VGANKIIFTGPVGAGKTTSIAAISDIVPFVTEQIATDETRQRKETTTVAMDYGMIKLPEGEKIHLYGTPGQDRFNFMWDILSEGGIGLVILIDNMRPSPLDDLKFFIGAFKEFIDKTAAVVGVTRMDLSEKPHLNDYHRILNESGLNVPVCEVDGRKSGDIVTLIQALLYSLDPGLCEPEAA
jgi:signal recognition particle receptor subunit beta